MKEEQGYKILLDIVFEDDHGFALGCNLMASKIFVVWQFTENENGQRDYYHGYFENDFTMAIQNLLKRRENFGYLNRILERSYARIPALYYRYYSTQRPVDIGTYPNFSDNKPVVIVNYDENRRRPVVGESFEAWGELTYMQPLTREQMEAYELRPAPCNKDSASCLWLQNINAAI